MLPLVGEPAQAASAVVEDRSSRPATILPIAARTYNRQRVLRGQELSCFFPELQLFDELLNFFLVVGRVSRILGGLLQIGFLSPLEQPLFYWFDLAHLAEQHNLPGQFALVLIQIFLVFGINPDRPALKSPIA